MDAEEAAWKVAGEGPPTEFSPLSANRPHYSEAWEAQVLAKNLLAEKEFEEETGIEIDDDLVRDSNHGCEVGCELLTLISQHAEDQDRPVFVPIRNGKVIEVNIDNVDLTSGPKIKETFHVIA